MSYQELDATFEPAPSFWAGSKLHDKPCQQIKARHDALHLGILIRRVDLTSDDPKPVQRRCTHACCEAHISCPSAGLECEFAADLRVDGLCLVGQGIRASTLGHRGEVARQADL